MRSSRALPLRRCWPIAALSSWKERCQRCRSPDVTLQQKDMLLALELGRKLGSPVPLAAAANEMMNACRELALDHRDFVTAHEFYRRLGGHA